MDLRTWIHGRECREFLYKLRIVDVLNKVEQPAQRTNFGTMYTMRERTKRGNNMRIPVCVSTPNAEDDDSREGELSSA